MYLIKNKQKQTLPNFYSLSFVGFILFSIIDSLVVSALQDLSGYAISRQNNLKLHLGCPTC